MAKVEISREQCESLIDLIECNLLDIIRQDQSIDNINWLVNICDVYKAAKAAVQAEEQETK